MKAYHYNRSGIVGPCKCGTDVKLAAYSVVGKPSRLRARGQLQDSPTPVVLGSGAYIGAHVVIEEGTRIGMGVTIDDGAVIESHVRIGKGAYIVHGARICTLARIEAGCVVGGFVADRSVIRANARVFGALLHAQADPAAPWDGTVERAPTVGRGAFVGYGAMVIGGVRIGARSYVCAGAIVTRDIPTDHIVIGVNGCTHRSRWVGRRLGEGVLP